MNPFKAALATASNEEMQQLALQHLQTTKNLNNVANQLKQHYQEARRVKFDADRNAQSDRSNADYCERQLAKLEIEPLPRTISKEDHETHKRVVDSLLRNDGLDVPNTRLDNEISRLSKYARCEELSMGAYLGCGSPDVVRAFIDSARDRISRLRRPSQKQDAANKVLAEWQTIVQALRARGIDIDAPATLQVAPAEENGLVPPGRPIAPPTGIDMDGPSATREVGSVRGSHMDTPSAAPVTRPVAPERPTSLVKRVLPTPLHALPQAALQPSKRAEKRKMLGVSETSNVSEHASLDSDSGTTSGSEHAEKSSSDEEDGPTRQPRKVRKVHQARNSKRAEELMSSKVVDPTDLAWLKGHAGKRDIAHNCQPDDCIHGGLDPEPALPPPGYVGLSAITKKYDLHTKGNKIKLGKAIDEHGIEYERVKAEAGGKGQRRLDTYIKEDDVEKAAKLIMVYKEYPSWFGPKGDVVLKDAIDGHQKDQRSASPDLPHPDTLGRRPA
jgi:hypothetical protein